MTARIPTALFVSALALSVACDDVDGGHYQEFIADVDVKVSERAQQDFGSYPAVVVAALVIDSDTERALEMGHVTVAVIDEPGEAITTTAGLYAALGPCIERDVQVTAWLAAAEETEPGEIGWALPRSEPVAIEAFTVPAHCGPHEADGLAIAIE